MRPPPPGTLTLAWPLALAAAVGCSGDASTNDGTKVTARPSALTSMPASSYSKGDTLTVDAVARSRADARDALRANRDVRISERRKQCLTMVRAAGTSLAEAKDEPDRVDTLLGFLKSYGAAFTDKTNPALSEAIDLEVVRPGVVVTEGPIEAVDVMVRQRVDDFGLLDALVMGRFIGLDLVYVGGCLVDPAASAPRVKTLAVPNTDAARAAFTGELGAATVAAGTQVRGWFDQHLGAVVWYLSDHRLDAVTGAYLGEVEHPKGDPITINESGQ